MFGCIRITEASLDMTCALLPQQFLTRLSHLAICLICTSAFTSCLDTSLVLLVGIRMKKWVFNSRAIILELEEFLRAFNKHQEDSGRQRTDGRGLVWNFIVTMYLYKPLTINYDLLSSHSPTALSSRTLMWWHPLDNARCMASRALLSQGATCWLMGRLVCHYH